ncbi:transglutaminase domain-containing protein [Candidatus Woesearchaeota archaeon]|nr:transglutaminase domain-containing protein [Candidatus Woesearchaeota archaeon]MBT6518234.1 transglutaminase domain-containing protein [Candidatus Woesearchaeota archaeon]
MTTKPDIHKEIVLDAVNEVNHDHEHHKHEHKKRSYFAKLLMGLGLAILIILMIVPYYGIKLNPEPTTIPSLEDVLPSNINLKNYLTNENITANQKDIFKQVSPNNPLIKQISSKVASKSCPSGNKICQSKAIFYFVRDNINYISDPPNEYFEHPLEVIYTGGSDCDGMAILLASMQKSIGIDAGFVFVPGHVFTQVYIRDAPHKYTDDAGWINLDATCKQCGFGELSYSVANQKKEYFKSI